MTGKPMRNDLLFETYYENFTRKKNESRNILSKNSKKPFLEDPNESYNINFFIISIAFNFFYFTHQILFFALENEVQSFLYTTLGIASAYILVLLISFILKILKVSYPNSKMLTALSFSTIYIQLSVVVFLSFLTKKENNDQSAQNSIDIIFTKFPFDFYLILCGSLAILSSELKFLLKHKILIIFYFMVTITMILFVSVIRKDFLILIISLSLLVLLFLICLYLMTKENILRKKLAKSREDSRRIFDNYLNMTKALNAGVFLLKNDDLFFYNEIGAKILSNAPTIASNKIKFESTNLNDDTIEMKHITPKVDIKVSPADSVLMLSEKKNLHYVSRRLTQDNNKEQIKFIFKNIFLFDDTSNFIDIMKNCKNTLLVTKKSTNFQNITEIDEINLKNINNFNSHSEERINLLSIFKFLLNSNSFPHTENNCHCVSHFSEHMNLGFFEIEFVKGKKMNYEIIVKLEKNSSKEINFEFIFKDVTPHYDLIRKMDEKNLHLKKNVHEFKTPILSLLGCAEELKSCLLLMEDFLPENDKIHINTYLEHITNLGSFITYLVKGLTVSNKEPTTKTIVVKTVKLKPLLKFCFSILQTLLSCDSEKLKNVKTEVKNKVEDVDVSFQSDEIQVKQILLNFISNAVKFTNYGKIILSSKLKKGNRGQFLKIKIKDTGCGVKKEDKAKLFQEYAKLNETKNNTFGTGLGLNICKTMADDLKMKIKFNSEEKKGTNVSLYIFNPDLKYVRVNSITNKSLDRSQYDAENSQSISHFGKGPLQRSLTTDFKSTLNTEIIVIHKSYTKLLKKDSIKTIRRYQSLKVDKSKSFEINEVDECDEEDVIFKTFSSKNEDGLSRRDTLANPISTNLNYSKLPYFMSHFSDRIELEEKHINRMSTKLLDKYHSYDINQIKQIPRIENEENNHSQYFIRNVNNNELLPENNVMDINPSKSVVKKNNLNISSSKANVNKLNKLNTSTNAILSRIHKGDSTQDMSSNKDKIIIVDDQLHSRRALLNLMNLHFTDKVANYELIEDCDGIDCLKTVIKFPHSVRYIFIDENMNFMNGSETAQIIGKLFSSGKISKIKIILTSAEENLNDRNQKSLFDLCVTKPLSRENLKNTFDILQ